MLMLRKIKPRWDTVRGMRGSPPLDALTLTGRQPGRKRHLLEGERARRLIACRISRRLRSLGFS